ncbi:hypothetical protein ES703_29189 [subsurface metagenome]
MRKKIEIIDRPSLTMRIDYDHLTVGELGNILIRLQAALRSIAGLSPGEYDRRYSVGQPRFITSAVSTKKSIDIGVQLAILAIIMAAPGAAYAWSRFGTDVFRLFKTTLLAMIQRKIRQSEDDIEIEGLRVEVPRGEIDIEASRKFLDELTPRQQRAVQNFLWSLTGPARKVNIGDDESEISIEWTEEDKGGE